MKYTLSICEVFAFEKCAYRFLKTRDETFSVVGSLWLCEDNMYPSVLSERGRYGTVLHLEERRVTEKWHSAFN